MRIDDFQQFLMVDDSETELFLTRAIFQHSYPGIPFRCERDAALAQAHVIGAGTNGVDAARICILLDIRMPRTNGFELIYKLRNDVGTYRCRILMLSGSRVDDDRDHSAAIGADGFVTKPFTLSKLEAALAGCEAQSAAA